MPDTEENKLVPIDTSGPDATVDIEEVKEEAVVETESTEKETETDKSFENERETKLEEKKSDETLEDYSKGVQSRIAKLTRKMREAERREQAALDYAKAVEEKRQILEKRFEKTDSEYVNFDYIFKHINYLTLKFSGILSTRFAGSSQCQNKEIVQIFSVQGANFLYSMV